MKLFEKRPLALLCAVFLLSAALSAAFSLTVKLSVALTTLFLSGCAFVYRHFHSAFRLLWCLCLLSVCLSICCSLLSIDVRQRQAQAFVKEEPVSVTARVTDKHKQLGADILTVRADEIDGRTCRLKMRLYNPTLSLEVGDVFTCTAQMSTDYVQYSDGIFAQLEGADDFTLVMHKNTIRSWLFRLKSTVASTMQSALGDTSGGLYLTLLIGDTSMMGDALPLSFRRLGLSHMLAISGLHLSVLCGVLYFVFRRIFRLRKRVYFALCSLFLLFYCLFAGASAGVVRATLMTFVVMSAFLFARSYDSLTSLFTAGAFMVLFCPTSVYDIGFWLSVTATLGILVGLRWLMRRRMPKSRLLAALLSTVTLTACATLSTLPLSVLCFGEYSLVCIPANLLFGVFLQVCLVVGLAMAILSFVPFVGAFVGRIAVAWEVLVCRIIHKSADVKGLMIELSFPQSEILWGIFAVALALFLCMDARKHKWLIHSLSFAFIAAMSVSLISHLYVQGRHEFIYESIDENDVCLYSEKGEHHLILSAAGTASAMYACADVINEYHVSELESLTLTHCHSGHGNVLGALLKTVRVRTLYLPDTHNPDEFEDMARIVMQAKRHDVPVSFYDGNESLALGKMEVTFWPKAVSFFAGADVGYGLTAKMGGRVISLYNIPYAMYGEDTSAHALLSQSDTVIVSAHAAPKSSAALPQGCPVPLRMHTLVLATPEMISFVREPISAEVQARVLRFSIR